MKTASFPSVQVEPELRQAAEDNLREGETIANFVEQSIRDGLARRLADGRFVSRALASRDQAARTGDYRSAADVIGGLENMLAKAKEKRVK